MSQTTLRQAHLFYFLVCSIEEEMDVLTEHFGVSQRTILRDMKTLHEAGLIRMKKMGGLNIYTHCNPTNHCPFLPPLEKTNQAAMRHIHRLIRLAHTMLYFESINELDYDTKSRLRRRDILQWYSEMFPDVGNRTRQRDFHLLKQIGFDVRYDPWMEELSVSLQL